MSDTRVRTHDGARLGGAARLPKLEDVQPATDPKFDVLGRMVSRNHAVVGALAGVGGLVGAKFGGARWGRVLGGTVGVGLGALAALTVNAVNMRRDETESSSTDAYVKKTGAIPGKGRHGVSGEQLRVLNWNVRELIGNGEGNEIPLRKDDAALDAVVEVVKRERPNVLILQEVGQGSLLSGYKDNIEELATRLGATDVVFVPNGIKSTGKAKGQAVLTFGDAHIQDARGLRHEDPHGSGVKRRILGSLAPLQFVGVKLPEFLSHGYMPRTTADVIVTTAGGTDIRILNEHLSGNGIVTGGSPNSTEMIDRQLGPISRTVDAWHGPTILGGDFNVSGNGQFVKHEAKMLEAVGLRDAFVDRGVRRGDPSTWTFSSRNPRSGLDRLYVSNEFAVNGVRVLRDAPARAGSDHLPVLADFTIS